MKRANFTAGRETWFKEQAHRRRISPLANAKMEGQRTLCVEGRNLPTHVHEVESLGGIRHRVSNLDAWCRQHEALFLRDATARVQPLWQRAANGIQVQAVGGAHVTQWRGWRLIAVVRPAGKK